MPPSNKLIARAAQPVWPVDRAEVMATALMTILQTLPDPGERRAAFVAYLRDEIPDIQRQAIHDNSVDQDG